jgi:hypothetical protein
VAPPQQRWGLPTVGLLGFSIVWWLGCAVKTRSADRVPTKAPQASEPANCAANVTTIERTTRRMNFSVENRSKDQKAGDIHQVRLLFTAARCPLSLESPAGWSGSIDTRAGQHACEVAWISDDHTGIQTGTKKDGFVALFRAGTIDVPSWAVFLDQCGVSGPQTPMASEPPRGK